MFEAGTVLDRYELLRPLAVGGMGEVHLARLQGAAGFGALVAIKVLGSNLSTNPAFVRMFLDEARNVARLRHENIVQIRDIALHQGQYYMVMEYIRGQNLRELLGDVSIRDTPLFTPRLGALMFADLASALAAVHEAGLVHRDLSPNNIMIADNGIPKIIDFGVARALGTASLTNPGTLKGKFTYMAPEYVRGEGYDHRLDIFSFGVVMWETFTRRRLFRGNHAAEQLRQVLEAKIPRLDEAVQGFPFELADLVASMLERDPTRRISSAATISERLREHARGFTEAGDRTLKDWLTRRVAISIEERRRRDEQAMEGTRVDLPVIVVGSGSGSGSHSGMGSHPGSQPSGSHPSAGSQPSGSQPSAGSHPSAGSYLGPGSHPGSQFVPKLVTPSSFAPTTGSLPSANGEAVANPQPVPSSRTSLYLIVAIGAVVLAVVAGISLRGGSESANTTPAAEVRPSRDGGVGERHRQAGIAALNAKDYQRAITELAEAMRHGVDDPGLLQLMELARKLKREATGSAVQTK